MGPASLSGVPGEIPEPSQEIVREREVGKRARGGTTSGHYSAQGPSAVCAQACFSLLVPLNSHSHPGILIQNLSLCFRLTFSPICCLSLLATDQHYLKRGKYIYFFHMYTGEQIFPLLLPPHPQICNVSYKLSFKQFVLK